MTPKLTDSRLNSILFPALADYRESPAFQFTTTVVGTMDSPERSEQEETLAVGRGQVVAADGTGR